MISTDKISFQWASHSLKNNFLIEQRARFEPRSFKPESLTLSTWANSLTKFSATKFQVIRFLDNRLHPELTFLLFLNPGSKVLTCLAIFHNLNNFPFRRQVSKINSYFATTAKDNEHGPATFKLEEHLWNYEGGFAGHWRVLSTLSHRFVSRGYTPSYAN